MNATTTETSASERIMQAHREFNNRPQPAGLNAFARRYVRGDGTATALAIVAGRLASCADQEPLTGARLAEIVEGALADARKEEDRLAVSYAETAEFAASVAGVR